MSSICDSFAFKGGQERRNKQRGKARQHLIDGKRSFAAGAQQPRHKQKVPKAKKKEQQEAGQLGRREASQTLLPSLSRLQKSDKIT